MLSGPPPTIQLFPQPDFQPSASPVVDDASAPVLLPLRPVTHARVLHVINGEHYSGAERVQDLLAERLPDEGVTADLVAIKPGRFGEVRQSQSRLTNLPMRGRVDLKVVRGLKQLVARHQYQILHAHTPRTALVTAIVARSLGMPWVYHVHSPVSRDSQRRMLNFMNGWVERFCLRSATRVIAVSPSLVPYMRQRGVDPARLVCVPNGVPSAERPRHWNFDHTPLTFGMVALFRPRKGTEVMLEAAAAAVSRGTDVEVRLIGGFETVEYKRQITALVEKLGISERTHFVGFTTNVAGELAKLDAMVLPSLYGEGLPMVVLEAMAAGVPVIASRVEGSATAIVHRESGLLVEPGSVSQLAEALEECAAGEVDLRALAHQARSRHAEQFSDVAMARGVAAVYRELLAEVEASQGKPYSRARDSRNSS